MVYYKCYFNNSSVLTKIKVKAIGLAKNLQNLRKEKGLTQEELANKLVEATAGGVNRAHIIDGNEKHALLLEIFTDQGIGTMVTKE